MPLPDASAACRGMCQDQIVVAPDLQVADRRALAHRRRHRPAVDDARDQPFARRPSASSPARRRSAPAARARRRRHKPWPRRWSGLRRTECAARNSRKPHSSSFLASSARSLAVCHAIDHHDEPQAVLHRRADQAVAGFLGESGLQAVGADLHRQKRIAVLLSDLVPGEFGLAEYFIELRIGRG